MPIRRLVAAALLAAVATGASAATAAAAPLPLPKSSGGHAKPSPNSLRVTVSESGRLLDSRTYHLECNPAGGTHPDPRAACEQLDRATVWGKSVFAETRQEGPCTQIHGGPATARIEGTWHGRPVEADFNRSNGCEIERWNRFGKVLATAA